MSFPPKSDSCCKNTPPKLPRRDVIPGTISKLLGHVNITMTARYAHHCPESLRAGIAVLENSDHDLVTVKETRNGQMLETFDFTG